jgi:hypothetical protein
VQTVNRKVPWAASFPRFTANKYVASWCFFTMQAIGACADEDSTATASLIVG